MTCRWAWRWITHRRCCWWVKLRTLAPARPQRRTETPALRSSTWWVLLLLMDVNKSPSLQKFSVVSHCLLVSVWLFRHSTSASTASITLRPSIRRWARRGLSCSHRSLEKLPTRWRAAAWGIVCVRTASTTVACPQPPAPAHCEWCFSAVTFSVHVQRCTGSFWLCPKDSTKVTFLSSLEIIFALSLCTLKSMCAGLSAAFKASSAVWARTAALCYLWW